jgi:cysteine desulfurase
MTRIYLDHAATTPVRPEVVEVMLPYLHNVFGNPSSIHGHGREARAAVDRAKREIASQIGAQPGELILTSGGTEADNLALIGVVNAYKARGKHIITSSLEHHAILHTCQHLEKQGFQVTYLPAGQDGSTTLEQVAEAIQEETILISLMAVNNETGIKQPIQEIGAWLKEHHPHVCFHTDAVQALGTDKLQLDKLPVDLLSVSGHKLNGPKGIGFLYVRKGVKLSPLMYGGSQERNRRAGTENVAAMVGLAQAIKLAYEELETRIAHDASCKQMMRDILEQSDIKLYVNGESAQSAAHILNVCFPGVKADALLMNLDLAGISASSGSACSAGSLQPSHVIKAMYPEQQWRAESSIRFSFGWGTTRQEVEQAAYTTVKLVKRLQKEQEVQPR